MRYLLPLLLAACGGGGGGGGGGPVQPLPQRPANAPDILIVSVSGHTDAIDPILCPDDNEAYLNDPGDAVEALQQAFDFLGLSHESHHFADRVDTTGIDRTGFDDMVKLLEEKFADWIDGFANPTRVVVVAHSHGTNWSHIASSIVDIPIEYLITLDAVCLLWECEHETKLTAWVQVNGPFPWDITKPCAAWDIPGQPGLLDTKDVVFPNVRYNLEVQSDTFLVQDTVDNWREDGSDDGLFLLQASEGHSQVHLAGGESMAWVIDRILALE